MVSASSCLGQQSGAELTYLCRTLARTNSASDYIAAAPAALYAITGDSICGKSITLNYQGKSVNVEIVDTCPECSTCACSCFPHAHTHAHNFVPQAPWISRLRPSSPWLTSPLVASP